MSKSSTGSVPVAAAIKRVTHPAPVPNRNCSVCGQHLPAGWVRHIECRTTNTETETA